MATIEDLLQGVPVGLLEQQCSDQHLLEISKWLPHWRNVSAHLGLSDVDEEQISHNPGGLARQNYDMLRMWRARLVGMATYRTLAKAFHCIGRQDLVERLCDLVRTEGTFITNYCCRQIINLYCCCIYSPCMEPIHH